MPIPVIPNHDEDICTSVSSSTECTGSVSEQNETFIDQNETFIAQNETVSENVIDSTSNVNDCYDEGSTLQTSEITSNSYGNDELNVSTTVDDHQMLLPTTQVYLDEDVLDGSAIISGESELDPIKQEPEFYLDEDEQNCFDEILNFGDEHDGTDKNANVSCASENASDDDEYFVNEGKMDKFPMPIPASQFGLTKREDDPISMSIAFSEKVGYFHVRYMKSTLAFHCGNSIIFRKTAIGFTWLARV